jgi:hypothetical protein
MENKDLEDMPNLLDRRWSFHRALKHRQPLISYTQAWVRLLE